VNAEEQFQGRASDSQLGRGKRRGCAAIRQPASSVAEEALTATSQTMLHGPGELVAA